MRLAPINLAKMDEHDDKALAVRFGCKPARAKVLQARYMALLDSYPLSEINDDLRARLVRQVTTTNGRGA
jgi:hypothetical protein